MIDTLNDLYSLKKTDINRAANIAAQAYTTAGDNSNLNPDPSKQLKISQILMKMTFKYSMKFGYVYATSQQIEGIVAWLPHDRTAIPLWRYLRYGVLKTLLLTERGTLNTLKKYDKICKDKHKEHANFPHWYLYNLAVHPDYQGKGYASKLLIPMLKTLDEKRMPCYLETGERNVKIYQHFGFEVVEQLTFDFINSDSDAYFMLRKPKLKED